MKKIVFLGLGSNLGDRLKYLKDALLLIESEIGDVIQHSKVYDTAAWGNTNQANFFNIVVSVSTSLSPDKLLDSVLGIEQKLGRKRVSKWGERCIDIDVLFYEREIIALAPKLVVPHPMLIFRKFVLQPLEEIAPDLVHPQFNKTIRELLEGLNDNAEVNCLGDIYSI